MKRKRLDEKDESNGDDYHKRFIKWVKNFILDEKRHFLNKNKELKSEERNEQSKKKNEIIKFFKVWIEEKKEDCKQKNDAVTAVDVAPNHLCIMVDTSISMGNYVQEINSSIAELLQRYKRCSKVLDTYEIVTFNSTVCTVIGKGYIKNNIITVDINIQPSPSTQLYSTRLYDSILNVLLSRRHLLNVDFILLTDGDDTTPPLLKPIRLLDHDHSISSVEKINSKEQVSSLISQLKHVNGWRTSLIGPIEDKIAKSFELFESNINFRMTTYIN